MAKKRAKSSRKPAPAQPPVTMDANADADADTAAGDDDGSVDPMAAAVSATVPHVSQKDLADASAEDVARASFDAPAAVLSPRRDEFADESGGVEGDADRNAATAATESFAASAAETVLSWKLARNGVAVSPLVAHAGDIVSEPPQKQQAAATNGVGKHDDRHDTAAAARRDFALEHIPGVQHIGSDHENYRSDDDDDDDANGGANPLLVPNIKTYDLNASSSGFLGQYIDEEVHRQPHTRSARGSHHSLPAFVHAASPCSSLTGGGGGSIQTAPIPHTKSLIMDDQNAAVVLQAMPSSKVEVVEVVAEQSWLITKLTVQLLWALRMSQRWMLCALRLTWFVVLLLPPLLRMALYFVFDDHVHKNIIFGLNGRNLLDVYTVPGSTPTETQHDTTGGAGGSGGDTGDTTPAANASGTDTDNNDDAVTGASAAVPPRSPVVVFFTGGAWIIGYKAWGALIGKVLSSFGIIVVTPDYRNFPQGIVPDMVDDATRAMQWVFDNIHLFGGDPENVTVVGQSAGAHIAVCALLELVEKKELALRRASSSSSHHHAALAGAPSPTFSTCSRASLASSVASMGGESLFAAAPSWELKQVRSFIGISGPYNIEVAVETFHRHGFDKNVVERIMAKKLAYYSPALRLLAKSELPDVARVLEDFPPVFLFHGTSDKTVSWRSTAQFASALEACRVPVHVRYFEGKSHTDPIIEDPILGDDFLLDEIRRIITQCAPRDANGATKYSLGALSPSKRYYPPLLVKAARKMNPF